MGDWATIRRPCSPPCSASSASPPACRDGCSPVLARRAWPGHDVRGRSPCLTGLLTDLIGFGTASLVFSSRSHARSGLRRLIRPSFGLLPANLHRATAHIPRGVHRPPAQGHNVRRFPAPSASRLPCRSKWRRRQTHQLPGRGRRGARRQECRSPGSASCQRPHPGSAINVLQGGFGQQPLRLEQNATSPTQTFTTVAAWRRQGPARSLKCGLARQHERHRLAPIIAPPIFGEHVRRTHERNCLSA